MGGREVSLLDPEGLWVRKDDMRKRNRSIDSIHILAHLENVESLNTKACYKGSEVPSRMTKRFDGTTRGLNGKSEKLLTNRKGR